MRRRGPDVDRVLRGLISLAEGRDEATAAEWFRLLRSEHSAIAVLREMREAGADVRRLLLVSLRFLEEKGLWGDDARTKGLFAGALPRISFGSDSLPARGRYIDPILLGQVPHDPSSDPPLEILQEMRRGQLEAAERLRKHPLPEIKVRSGRYRFEPEGVTDLYFSNAQLSELPGPDSARRRGRKSEANVNVLAALVSSHLQQVTGGESRVALTSDYFVHVLKQEPPQGGPASDGQRAFAQTVRRALASEATVKHARLVALTFGIATTK